MLIKVAKGTAGKLKVSHQWICTSRNKAETICLGISNMDFHVTVVCEYNMMVTEDICIKELSIFLIYRQCGRVL